MNCALRGLPLTNPRIMKNSKSFHSWQVHFCVLRLDLFLSSEQTAVIKETLRLATTTPAGLPRVVPPAGAMISGVWIPGGVCCVSCTFGS
jgi:hypothetical protein